MSRCQYYAKGGRCKKYSDRETTQFCVEGPCIEEHKSKLAKVISCINNWAAGFYGKFLADNKRKFT